jgi:hypothetical protein
VTQAWREFHRIGALLEDANDDLRGALDAAEAILRAASEAGASRQSSDAHTPGGVIARRKPKRGEGPDEPPSASRDPLRGGGSGSRPPQTLTVCRFAGGCLEANSSVHALRTWEHPAGRTATRQPSSRALLRGGRSVRRDTHQQHDEQVDAEPECDRGGYIGRHGGGACQTKRTLSLLHLEARTQTRRAWIARTRSRHRARTPPKNSAVSGQSDPRVTDVRSCANSADIDRPHASAELEASIFPPCRDPFPRYHGIRSASGMKPACCRRYLLAGHSTPRSRMMRMGLVTQAPRPIDSSF